jgi:hypothetical protein
MSDQIEEPVRETARGVDDETPVRALTGVYLVVLVVAGILIALLTFLWWYLAR